MRYGRRHSNSFYLGTEEDKKPILPKKTRTILNVMLIVFAAIVLGYGLVVFGAQTIRMSGQSMSGTIEDNDTLLLNKAIYIFTDVKRYDVVAIRKMDVKDSSYEVKRVVGLPGDKISVTGGKLVVNGKAVSDEYPCSNVSDPGILRKTVTVGNGEYFVIGDNTSNSDDSRYVSYGMVQKSEIKGRIKHRLFAGSGKGKIK